MAYHPRGRVFVAKKSFSYFENGCPRTVVAGQRVRENHPVMEGRERLFKLDDSIWELPETPVKNSPK